MKSKLSLNGFFSLQLIPFHSAKLCVLDMGDRAMLFFNYLEAYCSLHIVTPAVSCCSLPYAALLHLNCASYISYEYRHCKYEMLLDGSPQSKMVLPCVVRFNARNNGQTYQHQRRKHSINSSSFNITMACFNNFFGATRFRCCVLRTTTNFSDHFIFW